MIIKFLLWLRYCITVSGLDEVRRRGTTCILFLPNHPALIDPVMLATLLHPHFQARPLAFEDQINRPVIRYLTDRIRTIAIPDLRRAGRQGLQIIAGAIQAIIDGLRQNDNFILYPAGRACRTGYEELRSNSAVEKIITAVPQVRIVLVRTTGLWGSSFSWAGGTEPHIGAVLKKAVFYILANGIFFSPRRQVNITFVEADNFPHNAGRKEINRFLEDFYNQDAPPKTYVPYFWWQGRRH
jgi:long-chain-fatty-acid--[acyl-carrier-protein] ligase